MTATDRALDPTYTVSQVLALTGAKYRFVDYAIRAGYLDNDTASGSGSQRRFSTEEIDVIYAVQALIGAGFTLAAAFPAARHLVAENSFTVQAGEIYDVTIALRQTAEVPTSQEAPA